jgi:hypothetical protein
VAAEGVAQSAANDLRKQLSESQAAVRRLEGEAAALGSEGALLNERLGRGEFNKSKTKVGLWPVLLRVCVFSMCVCACVCVCVFLCMCVVTI